MRDNLGLIIWESLGITLLVCTIMLFKGEKMTERCRRCDRLLHECECPHG